MAVCSDKNCYGIEEGLIFGMPVICANGKWQFVPDFTIGDTVRRHIEATTGRCRIGGLLFRGSEERGRNC